MYIVVSIDSTPFRKSIALIALLVFKILEKYVHIKKIDEALNRITSITALFFVVGSFPFLSEDMIENTWSEPAQIMYPIFTMIGFLLSMWGSAEANKEVKFSSRFSRAFFGESMQK